MAHYVRNRYLRGGWLGASIVFAALVLCVLISGDASSAIRIARPAAAPSQLWLSADQDGPSCEALSGGLAPINYTYNLPGFELAVPADVNPQAKEDPPCTGTMGSPGTLPLGAGGDIVISGFCNVNGNAKPYQYHNINVIKGGTLNFTDAQITFWAESILVENGGSLIAGTAITPIGTAKGRIIINLWGQDQGIHGEGIRCKQSNCGIPGSVTINKIDTRVINPKSCTSSDLLNGVNDCFYQYQPLNYDDGGGNAPGFFGYKVIGVGFGGTLQMFGLKGATYPDNLPASSSGSSWVRLNNCPNRSNTKTPTYTCQDGVLQIGATQLIVSSAVKTWASNDNIVLTTTDYLPDHSEQLQVKSVSADGLTVTLMKATVNRHNASTYDLTSRLPTDANDRGLTDLTAIDTRAAVALLTRSITIQSGGKKLLDPFPAPESACPPKDPNVYFGGHVIFRQGFKVVQVQGVEFYQLGQGGKIAHYPVHFHMARTAPANTFIKDSSVWDSMTRWYVVHGTHRVLLARNVGYRSIGHGYYIEDGTEIENQLYSNIGISALAAVCSPDNKRGVPGIFAWDKASTDPKDVPFFPPLQVGYVPYRSDFHQPTIFWIMNGWNDFQYNLAVGAQTCGFCYWWPPAIVSGPSQYEAWFGYASEQERGDHSGSTPLEEFYGNQCATSQNAFNEVGDLNACYGVGAPTNDVNLKPIHNDLTDKIVPTTPSGSSYYPRISGGFRTATRCPGGADTGDCSNVTVCANGGTQAGSPSANCEVTILDHFTTSFNWSEQNFAAVWLRNQWNMVVDSAITDVQAGGVNFVTGGGYTRADAILGLWQLARKDVFVGNTQTAASDPYAENGGPFNSDSGLKCDDQKQESINYCLNAQGGIVMQLSNWGVGQRLFSIYDGPSLEDSNAFFDITPTTLNDCDLTTPNYTNRCMKSASPYGRVLGIRGINKGSGNPPGGCYLANAAIGWKQPNGFYYPPAFDSQNLFFKNVTIRHYVIEPIFTPNTQTTDPAGTAAQFCNWNHGTWTGYTSIDRQTELSDDDGTLTGLDETTSVNEDNFFNAPSETVECASDIPANPAGTAKTSPYYYVSLVVFPECASGIVVGKPAPIKCNSSWGLPCSNERCYGVPLYRQFLNPDEYTAYQSNPLTAPNIRMMGGGNGQRSTMIPNNGRYYMDLTVPKSEQLKSADQLNVFQGGATYHVFFVYAKPGTKEALQFYVGTNFNMSTLKLDVANINTGAYTFTTASIPPQWGTPTLTNGVLTLNVNMNFPAFTTDYNNSFATRCQPVNFCSWNSSTKTCGCNPKDPHYAACVGGSNNVPACYWATKAMDCPDGGCYGFEFTLPYPYTPPTNSKPAPGCYPMPVWNEELEPVSMDLAGSCYYSAPPPVSDFCSATPQTQPEFPGLL